MIDSETERHVKCVTNSSRSAFKIPHSKLNGDRERRNASTVNFCFEGIGRKPASHARQQGHQRLIRQRLHLRFIRPQPCLAFTRSAHEVAHGSLRLSLGRYNTKNIDHIIYWVPKVVEKLREMSPLWEDLEKAKHLTLFKIRRKIKCCTVKSNGPLREPQKSGRD